MLRLDHNPTYGWVHGDWVGVHSFETVQKGMEAVLELIIATNSTKYLSDNTNLIGGWDIANEWLANDWTPRATAAGMRCVAHVLAPGIYGQMSMLSLSPHIEQQICLSFFDNIKEAEEWLKTA